jgi:hypothetical protein
MFKRIIKFLFGSARKPVHTGILVVSNKKEYKAYHLTQAEMVKNACIDLTEFGTKHFTPAMIYAYLDGLVSISNIYKYLHKLKNKGFLINVYSFDANKKFYCIKN